MPTTHRLCPGDMGQADGETDRQTDRSQHRLTLPTPSLASSSSYFTIQHNIKQIKIITV